LFHSGPCDPRFIPFYEPFPWCCLDRRLRLPPHPRFSLPRIMVLLTLPWARFFFNGNPSLPRRRILPFGPLPRTPLPFPEYFPSVSGLAALAIPVTTSRRRFFKISLPMDTPFLHGPLFSPCGHSFTPRFPYFHLPPVRSFTPDRLSARLMDPPPLAPPLPSSVQTSASHGVFQNFPISAVCKVCITLPFISHKLMSQPGPFTHPYGSRYSPPAPSPTPPPPSPYVPQAHNPRPRVVLRPLIVLFARLWLVRDRWARLGVLCPHGTGSVTLGTCPKQAIFKRCSSPNGMTPTCTTAVFRGESGVFTSPKVVFAVSFPFTHS